jgi:hypothetical protein
LAKPMENVPEDFRLIHENVYRLPPELEDQVPQVEESK